MAESHDIIIRHSEGCSFKMMVGKPCSCTPETWVNLSEVVEWVRHNVPVVSDLDEDDAAFLILREFGSD